VTSLRQSVLDELQRRNYSPATTRGYIHAIKQFAEYFGKSPEQLGAEEIRRFELHLLKEKKLAPATVEGRMSALRFLYRKTLKRRCPASGWRPSPPQCDVSVAVSRVPSISLPEERFLHFQLRRDTLMSTYLRTQQEWRCRGAIPPFRSPGIWRPTPEFRLQHSRRQRQ